VGAQQWEGRFVIPTLSGVCVSNKSNDRHEVLEANKTLGRLMNLGANVCAVPNCCFMGHKMTSMNGENVQVFGWEDLLDA